MNNRELNTYEINLNNTPLGNKLFNAINTIVLKAVYATVVAIEKKDTLSIISETLNSVKVVEKEKEKDKI